MADLADEVLSLVKDAWARGIEHGRALTLAEGRAGHGSPDKRVGPDTDDGITPARRDHPVDPTHAWWLWWSPRGGKFSMTCIKCHTEAGSLMSLRPCIAEPASSPDGLCSPAAEATDTNTEEAPR